MLMLTEKELVLEAVKIHTASDPIHGKALATIAGLRGSEAVRRIINTCRKEGIPVASSEDGYWMAKSAPELEGCIRELQGRVNSLQMAIDGLRRASFSTASYQEHEEESFTFRIDWS